jgi:hypothetical protein
MTVKETKKKYIKPKTRKNPKKRRLFSIPKPKTIPTKNRHLDKKNDPDPDRLPNVHPAGLYKQIQ